MIQILRILEKINEVKIDYRGNKVKIIGNKNSIMKRHALTLLRSF